MSAELIIVGVRDLPQTVQTEAPAAVVSIESPRMGSRNNRAPRLAKLGYEAPQLIHRYLDTEDENNPRAPKESHVGEALDFLLEGSRKAAPVIAQCRLGISRSAAIGLTFLAATRPEETPEQWIARLKAIRPHASPNLLIIKHGDKILGLRGALERAVTNDNEFARARDEFSQAKLKAAQGREAFNRLWPHARKPDIKPEEFGL